MYRTSGASPRVFRPKVQIAVGAVGAPPPKSPYRWRSWRCVVTTLAVAAVGATKVFRALVAAI